MRMTPIIRCCAYVVACGVWLGLNFSQDGCALFSRQAELRFFDFPKLSQDGKLLAVVESLWQHKQGQELPSVTDLTVLVFSTTTGECIFKDAVDVHQGKRLVGLEWDPANPDTLVYGSKRKSLWQVDLKNQKARVMVDSLNLPVIRLVYSRDGKYLALVSWDAAGEDYRVQVLEVASRKQVLHINSLSVRSQIPPACSFSDCSNLLAVTDYDSIFIYNLAAPHQGAMELASQADSSGDYFSLAFSPDGKTLAGSHRNGTIHFFDLGNRTELGTVELSPRGALDLRYLRKGNKPQLILYDDRDAVILECGATIRPVWSHSFREQMADEGAISWFTTNQRGDLGALLIQSKAGLQLRSIDLVTRQWSAKPVVLRR